MIVGAENLRKVVDVVSGIVCQLYNLQMENNCHLYLAGIIW